MYEMVTVSVDRLVTENIRRLLPPRPSLHACWSNRTPTLPAPLLSGSEMGDRVTVCRNGRRRLSGRAHQIWSLTLHLREPQWMPSEKWEEELEEGCPSPAKRHARRTRPQRIRDKRARNQTFMTGSTGLLTPLAEQRISSISHRIVGSIRPFNSSCRNLVEDLQTMRNRPRTKLKHSAAPAGFPGDKLPASADHCSQTSQKNALGVIKRTHPHRFSKTRNLAIPISPPPPGVTSRIATLYHQCPVVKTRAQPGEIISGIARWMSRRSSGNHVHRLIQPDAAAASLNTGPQNLRSPPGMPGQNGRRYHTESPFLENPGSPLKLSPVL